MTTNEGARQLSDVEASLRTIAEKLNVSREMVRQWRAGKKLPAAENRDALFQAFGIPVEAWDQAPAKPGEGRPQRPAKEPSKSPSKPSPKAAAKALRTAEEAEEQASEKLDAEARLRAQIARLDAMRKAEVSPTALIKIERLETQALKELSRITGESSQISEDTIVRHPAFRRILEAITEAIEPCPKCVIAVDEALAKLE